MARKMTYAVRLPNGKWGRTNNKAEAIKAAKKHDGAVVYMKPYSPDTDVMDWPTFAVSGRKIYPAKKTASKRR